MTRDWLRAVRNDLGMSQAKIASELGITQSAYCRFEHGTRLPDDILGFFAALSRLTGRPAVEFFMLEMAMRNDTAQSA